MQRDDAFVRQYTPQDVLANRVGERTWVDLKRSHLVDGVMLRP